MAQSERIKADAKHAENKLRNIGENTLADRVATLRVSYAAAITQARLIHRDYMELRQKLGLPSFLDQKAGK